MKPLRGLVKALNDNRRFKYKSPQDVVDYLVIGGGVVGLATAQRLAEVFPSKSTYLVERHPCAGVETSSRNSEVIHSGLYYPADSLKTRLCLRGRDLMYKRCKERHIPYKQTGKLVVAREGQQNYIENLHRKASSLQWPRGRPNEADNEPVLPTELLSGHEARSMEPDLSNDIVAALWCPKTGIIDSHSFMQSLEQDIIDSEGGQLVYSANVVRIDPYLPDPSIDPSTLRHKEELGWVVQIQNNSKVDHTDTLLARTVINAGGLSSTFILNSILPPHKRIPIYYARGSYASYHGPGASRVSRLIYPCPETGPNAHAFESLGTHLTLDLQGKIRFGPDIEWLSPPEPKIGEEEDFWAKMLVPDDSRIPEIQRAVTTYLHGITLEGLQSDYTGIRPKLIPPGHGFQDFVVRRDYCSSHAETNGWNPMVSLLGIESPGLTSSLAIAEAVVDGFAAEGRLQ